MGVTRAPLTLPLSEMARPRVPLPGVWTFWADTMVGGRALGNVDVSSFYCVKRLSAFGHGNVTVNLPSGIDAQRMLNLWSWRLWAFYDSAPYWCGVPTGVADQDGSAHAQFTLIELPGYLTRRQWDYHPDRSFNGWEQTAIAAVIAEPLPEVGVLVSTEVGASVLRDRTYEYLEGGSRGQLLINLSQVLEGPEFRADYRMNPATLRPECTLRIAYPRVGSDISGLGLTVPGAVVGYRAQWDSDQLRTRTFAVGDLPHDSEGGPRPVSVVNRPNPDLPRLDAVDEWPGTIRQSTLDERARTMAALQAAPGQSLTGSPPESFPAITSYGPGDTVTLFAVTPLVPQGIELMGRLAQIEVNAATGVATWTVTMSQPPQKLRESLAGGLVRLDTATSAAFRSGGLRPPREITP